MIWVFVFDVNCGLLFLTFALVIDEFVGFVIDYDLWLFSCFDCLIILGFVFGLIVVGFVFG